MNLRQILKRYKDNQTLLSTDASTVRQNLHDSTAFSDVVKTRANGAEWYCIRAVGAHRVRMLHLCYAKDGDTGCIPLPLGKLEARPAKRKSTAKKSSSARNRVLEACRASIQLQIDLYRDYFWASHFKLVQQAAEQGLDTPSYPRCPLSGKSLWSNKTHVDHVYPFVRMVDDWLAEIGLSFEQICCTKSKRLKRMSMGDTLDESWQDYHQKHAVLQLVEARANMRKGSKCTN